MPRRLRRTSCPQRSSLSSADPSHWDFSELFFPNNQCRTKEGVAFAEESARATPSFFGSEGCLFFRVHESGLWRGGKPLQNRIAYAGSPFLKSGDFPNEITVFHDGQLADGRERSLLGTASRFPRRDPASLDAIAWYWAQGCYISICTPLIFHYEKEIGHREGFLRFVLHGYLLHLC